MNNAPSSFFDKAHLPISFEIGGTGDLVRPHLENGLPACSPNLYSDGANSRIDYKAGNSSFHLLYAAASRSGPPVNFLSFISHRAIKEDAVIMRSKFRGLFVGTRKLLELVSSFRRNGSLSKYFKGKGWIMCGQNSSPNPSYKNNFE